MEPFYIPERSVFPGRRWSLLQTWRLACECHAILITPWISSCLNAISDPFKLISCEVVFLFTWDSWGSGGTYFNTGSWWRLRDNWEMWVILMCCVCQLHWGLIAIAQFDSEFVLVSLQLRDFLLVYNRMTESCFQRCSSNFNYRNLTMDEVGVLEISDNLSPFH